MTNYEFAKRFAKIVHHGQKYGTHSYDYHLLQVEMALQRFGFTDEKLKISAWLHDVIEDTKISYDKIKYGFGGEIADIVYSVTNEMGRNRKERYAKTYPKIRDNKDGLIIKLADRIANIEFSKGMNTGFADMYQAEWSAFEASLKDEREADPRVKKMWDYLKSLFEENQEMP
jgi:(p)ppGpp synthase/HD superfamily hydrolase